MKGDLVAESRSGRETALWSVGIVLIILFSLIPVLWIVSISFKAPDSITAGDSLLTKFFPQDLTLENYKGLFEGGLDSPLLAPLINSIGIALIATTIAIVLAAFAAYAIA